MNRITPENITELKPNQIFIFGSNLSGIHGAGAACLAMDKFGAEYGIGVGITGQCYAIPTKSHGIARSLTLGEIKPYVDDFINFAISTPDYDFLVTQIGCGLANFKPQQIAPLFKNALTIKNIYLPQIFINLLHEKTNN